MRTGGDSRSEHPRQAAPAGPSPRGRPHSSSALQENPRKGPGCPQDAVSHTRGRGGPGFVLLSQWFDRQGAQCAGPAGSWRARPRPRPAGGFALSRANSAVRLHRLFASTAATVSRVPEPLGQFSAVRLCPSVRRARTGKGGAAGPHSSSGETISLAPGDHAGAVPTADAPRVLSPGRL